jgi:hypothetical protein
LQLHLPADEGTGNDLKLVRNGTPGVLTTAIPAEWRPGQVAAQGLYFGQAGLAELSDVGDYDRDQPFSVSAWVKLPANDGAGAILARMDDTKDFRGWDLWVEGRRVGCHIIHKWQDDALKVVSKTQVPGDQWTHLTVTYDGSGKAGGVKVYYNGQEQGVAVHVDALKSTTKTEVPFKLGQRHTGSPLTGVTINDLRLYGRSLSAGEVGIISNVTRYAAIIAKPAGERTPEEVNELFTWYLQSQDQPYQHAVAQQQALEREQQEIKARGTIAHVMHEKSEEAMAYILFRGEYDKRRDAVKASTPAALPAFPAELPKNRLGLAQWLLSPDHPLTARVTVNRFWQEVFGTGLVRTTGDLGISGELPSHPQLLDWLALEFREQQWDVRRFFKLLVTSATYRQAALTTTEKLEADPANRYLSRGPRFRMDAEMVRDYALSATGILVPKLGGPSVKPYQPDGVWEAVAMIGSNTRDYKRDTGENLYRRSLYTFWKRSAPPASMDILNAPAREVCTVRRERTNTPLQALVTLNDEQFVEAAKFLAQRTLQAAANDDERLQFIARQLLARPWSDRELVIARGSLADLRGHYGEHPEDAERLLKVGEFTVDAALPQPELAAWTMLINQLMNLDEVLCK